MGLKIGISGKRLIAKNEEKRVAREIEQAINTFLKKHSTDEFVGYTSLAIGADTIFARVVQTVFKKPIHVILPFDKQEYEKDFITADDLSQLNTLIEKQEITTVSDRNPKNDEERSECYFTAGKHVTDVCDEVLFVWDELKPDGRGGTAEVIGYYCEKRKQTEVPYIRVHPLKEDLLHMQIIKAYNSSNKAAMKHRDNYKKVWKSALFLGWLAVAVFATGTGYKQKEFVEWLFVTCELLLLTGVFILITIAKKRNFHGKYLNERIKAERYRIIKYFYHSNTPIKISAFTIKDDINLSKLVLKINDEIKHASYKSHWYANYVIKSLIEEQKKYHLKKATEFDNWQRFFHVANSTIGALLFLNLLFRFAVISLKTQLNSHFYADSESLTTLLTILLPASYAAIEGVLFFQDWDVIKKYSESAKVSLLDCIPLLPATIENPDKEQCFTKQSETLNLISSIMLSDNRNWTLILEDKSNYHWVL